MKVNARLALEAKAIVALCFRNGPIEDVHAGIECPTCAGNPEYSHIRQTEMKRIMKHAVNRVYMMLLAREQEPAWYVELLAMGADYTTQWDPPEEVEGARDLKNRMVRRALRKA